MSERKKLFVPLPENANWKLRILVWCAALLLCAFFSVLVLVSADDGYREYDQVECQPHSFLPYKLIPGAHLEQCFTAQGKSTGEVWSLFLNILCENQDEGQLDIRLYRESTGETLMRTTVDFADLPGCRDLGESVREAEELYHMAVVERPAYEEVNKELTTAAMLSGDSWFYLHSGEKYRLEIINRSETQPVYLLGNADIQSGELQVNGTKQPGFLNLSWMRKSLYSPSMKLLVAMVALTDLTVLVGLALVLFTNLKEHVLYLVLAVGFGFVMLFDLTPLYGFDMRFQFDSAYVLSNKMLGLDGAILAPSQSDPNQMVLSYYRRACDDYSQYQLYYHDEVSANYTDMKAALRDPFASEEGKNLILAETDLGFISDQLYMYLPQAIGFTAARLLGLGMYPMLQLARIMAYAVFVIAMYFAIRDIPFGKRIFLIWALVPTVMVQTISITRDAMIICMGFYVISKGIQMAYSKQKPTLWNWIPVLVVSVLLAPCKMIYAPIALLNLLTVYRQYILPAGKHGRKLVLRFALAGAAFVVVFIAANMPTIRSVLFSEGTSLYNTASYSVPLMLAQPLRTLFVLGNTIRTQLGEYLVNAVQLFNIHLGCSDGITLIIFICLALECCCADTEYAINPAERSYMLLVAVAVFCLTAVASLRWTPVESDVIEGLQGRYLTPVLPLVCLAFHNNSLVRVNANAALLTKVCCCLFPAISLMNMYLWTIAQ